VESIKFREIIIQVIRNKSKEDAVAEIQKLFDENVVAVFSREDKDWENGLMKQGVLGKPVIKKGMKMLDNKEPRSPKVTVDCIIFVGGMVVLIKRKYPPLDWALPGGFVEYGETCEEAVRREMWEETGLELEDLKQFHVYSEHHRDARWHCISIVFVATGKGEPKSGDDACDLSLIDVDDVDTARLAFDHGKIIEDYRLTQKKS